MKTTTYSVWTVEIDEDGYFENRGEGSDFALTVKGVLDAFAAADEMGKGWAVIIEKRMGDGYRCHDMEDATVAHIAATGTFLSGVQVPARIDRICRSAILRRSSKKSVTN